MKAISIRQPWAWLVCKGRKKIENRTWNTRYRGTVVIHASGSADDCSEVWDDYRIRLPKDLPLGALIGTVEIVDVVEDSDDPFFSGPLGFVLRKPILFAKPIPFKGKLGIYELDAATVAKVRRAQPATTVSPPVQASRVGSVVTSVAPKRRASSTTWWTTHLPS